MKAKPEPLTIEEVRRRATISAKETAAFIGVSTDSVYEAAARGELKVLHLGGRILISTAALLRALDLED